MMLFKTSNPTGGVDNMADSFVCPSSLISILLLRLSKFLMPIIVLGRYLFPLAGFVVLMEMITKPLPL